MGLVKKHIRQDQIVNDRFPSNASILSQAKTTLGESVAFLFLYHIAYAPPP